MSSPTDMQKVENLPPADFQVNIFRKVAKSNALTRTFEFPINVSKMEKVVRSTSPRAQGNLQPTILVNKRWRHGG